jgi:hypothetical protein
MDSNRIFENLMNAMPRPEGKEDWVYKDIRWLTTKLWESFTDMIGKDNYLVIVQMTRNFPDEPNVEYVGAQLFISPEGMKNISEYVKNKPDGSKVVK